MNTDVDWDRTYPSVAGISPIYGRVSSYEQGLPANLSGYYKAHDYQSNDRVGLSQLELYYEALLRGSKSQYVLKMRMRFQTIKKFMRDNVVMS